MDCFRIRLLRTLCGLLAGLGGAAAALPAAAQLDMCRALSDFDGIFYQNAQVYIYFNGAYVPAGATRAPNPTVACVQYCNSVNNQPYSHWQTSDGPVTWTEVQDLTPVSPPAGRLVLKLVPPYHAGDAQRYFAWSVSDPVNNTNDAFELTFWQQTHDFSPNNCYVSLQKPSFGVPNQTSTFTQLSSNSFSQLWQTDRYYINLINMPVAPTVETEDAFPLNPVVIVITPISGYQSPDGVNAPGPSRDPIVQAALVRRGLDPHQKLADRTPTRGRVVYRFAGTDALLVVDDRNRRAMWVEPGKDGTRQVVDSFRY